MNSLIEKAPRSFSVPNRHLSANRFLMLRCSLRTRTFGTFLFTRHIVVDSLAQPECYRFMGLNDLMSEIKQDQTCFIGDEAVENKVLKQVLALVEDKISEVKNQAVKWHVSLCFGLVKMLTNKCGFSLGQLIKIIRQTQMELVVDKLIEFSGGKDEELRDISGLGTL